MAKKFITIKEDSYDEFVEKKSTFITHLIRINSEEEAREFIQKMKKMLLVMYTRKNSLDVLYILKLYLTM